MSGCTAYEASTHVCRFKSDEADIVLFKSIVDFTYCSMRFNLRQSSSSDFVVRVHKNEIGVSISGHDLLHTHNNVITILWKTSPFSGDNAFVFGRTSNKCRVAHVPALVLIFSPKDSNIFIASMSRGFVCKVTSPSGVNSKSIPAYVCFLPRDTVIFPNRLSISFIILLTTCRYTCEIFKSSTYQHIVH